MTYRYDDIDAPWMEVRLDGTLLSECLAAQDGPDGRVMVPATAKMPDGATRIHNNNGPDRHTATYAGHVEVRLPHGVPCYPGQPAGRVDIGNRRLYIGRISHAVAAAAAGMPDYVVTDQRGLEVAAGGRLKVLGQLTVMFREVLEDVVR